MNMIPYWASFSSYIPDKLSSGLSIAVFFIILFISTATAQEPKKTPEPNATPTASPTPDALIDVTPTSIVIDRQNNDKDYDVVKVNVNLVNLSVSAADQYDRLVPDLKKENFEVYEYENGKKVKQEIAFFTYADTPILIGVIPDISGSMSGDKMKYLREAISTFLRSSNKSDDIFVMGFDEKVWLIQDSTTNDEAAIDSITNKLALIEPPGRQTALYDAMHVAISKIQERNRIRVEQGKPILKMALFLISDGQDNHSRYTFKEIKEELKETDVIIYSIVIPPPNGSDMNDPEILRGKDNLVELSEITGGKAYLPDFPLSLRFPDETILTRPPLTLDGAVTRIAFELRRQYTIAYYPTNKARDGKYRKIYIKVIPPKGLPKLNVRTKQGYYAPKG